MMMFMSWLASVPSWLVVLVSWVVLSIVIGLFLGWLMKEPDDFDL